MSPRPVGFYVHHHGSGHANRTRLLAARLAPGVPVHVFTSAPEAFADWTRGTVHPLPADTVPERDPRQDLLSDEVLHYAPVDLAPLQDRMALLANWFATARPEYFVVDLSVEIALFARLCGVRTALMRLHGHRDDPAHRAAFGLAEHLLAPFPEILEDAHTPAWVRRKTTYLGAFSRYDARTESRSEARRQLALPDEARVLTVVNGTGGGAQDQSRWTAIARACPDWIVLLVGFLSATGGSVPNLRPVGRVADTFPYLKAADVVVGSGGTNTMMEIGAARVPFLSLPEKRPFGEQRCKMEALARLGLTEIGDPELPPRSWPALLEHVRRMDTSDWDLVFVKNAEADDPFRNLA